MALFLRLCSICDLVITTSFSFVYDLVFINHFSIHRLLIVLILCFLTFLFLNFTDIIRRVFVFQILALLDSELVEELELILELSILVNANRGIRRRSCNHLQ